MLFGGRGLADVSTKDVKVLLGHLHRGELSCPITPAGLAVLGLQRISDDLDLLRGLDARGVRAVLVAVVAERSAP